MSKRQEIRARRNKERLRNRILVILLVVAGALVITFAMILPGLKKPDLGTIVQITPAVRVAAVNGSSLGDPKASVKMDVWEDFQCSGCRSYSDSTEPQIIQKYVDTGKVYYTFHFYPFIDGGRGESHQAANAAMCALAQSRFWDYHDMLFANWTGENVGAYTDNRLVAFAQNINLDMTAFNQCFKANTYSAKIQQDIDAGSKLGVPPTPGIFINGSKVLSSAGENYLPSVDDISKLIEAALAGE
jgi:protein-disulfide isomerase